MPSPIFDFFDCSSTIQPMGAEALVQAADVCPILDCPECGEQPSWIKSRHVLTGERTSGGGGGGGGGRGAVCQTCETCTNWNEIEAQFPNHAMYANMADNLQDDSILPQRTTMSIGEEEPLAMGSFGGYEIMSVGAASVAKPVMKAAQPPSRPVPYKPSPAPAPKPAPRPPIQNVTLRIPESGPTPAPAPVPKPPIQNVTLRMPESGPTPAPTPAPKPPQMTTMALGEEGNPYTDMVNESGPIRAPAPAPKPPQMTTMMVGEEGNPYTDMVNESGPIRAPAPVPNPTPPKQKVTMAFICSENPAACGQTPPTPTQRPVVDPHNCSCLTGSGQMQSLKGYLSTGDSVFSVF